MLNEIIDRFNLILNFFVEDTHAIAIINKAFDYAKNLHGEQKRKDGKLYLSHPVEVALILARLGFDEDVICGALLHDVVEDCDCDLDTIKREFNHKVANIVDSVSAIDKEKYILNKESLFENEEFQKHSMEEQTFKKLIEIGKENPLGFCVKFADRLHNLSTIECFDYNKQLEKVKETEKWILPIAKILNTSYFYYSIKNLCFRIKNQFDKKEFFEHYDIYHKSNVQNINQIRNKLKEYLSNVNIQFVEIEETKEVEVYENLCNLIKSLKKSKISQGQILKVSNYKIYLMYKNGEPKDMVNNVLNVLNGNLNNLFKIIDAKIDEFNKKPYFLLEDRFKNKFNMYIVSVNDYQMQQNGTLSGRNDVFDEELDNLTEELIKVKTRSGEIKYIEKGSTVLDFAFKLHKDIGLSFKYAIINGSKTKQPPYVKLLEGDKVEIFTEKDEENQIKYIADLKWFAYVNTNTAKKALIKYFDKRFNN